MSPILIHNANEWATTFGAALWRVTVQGGAFIAAVWLICAAFRKMPAWARHWLWWLACAQMFVRLLIVSPIALPLLPAPPQVEWAEPAATYEAMTYIADPQPALSNAPVGRTAVVEPAKESPSIALLAMTAWACGILACLFLVGMRLVKTKILLERGNSLEGVPVAALVDEISGSWGIRRPALLESSSAPCPMLAGWIRPTILLPQGSADQMSEQDLRICIAHELAHLQRKDLWLAIVPALTRVLFFFHPLAWLASHEANAACEEACDAEALRMSGVSPAVYARLLLSSVQSNAPVAALGTALGYRLLLRRITMLTRSSGLSATRYRRACTGLIALCAVCALPWTVTAQSAKPKASTAQPKKVVKHTAKKKSSHKSTAKKRTMTVTFNSPPAAPSATYMVTSSNGKVSIVQAPGAPKAPKPMTFITSGAIATAPEPPAAVSGFSYTVPSKAPVAFYPAQAAKPSTVIVGKSFGNGFSYSTAPRAKAFTTYTMAPKGTSFVRFGGGESDVSFNSEDKTLTASFQRTDLREALLAIFKSAHASFSIRSDVETDRVTCNLSKMSLEEAVDTILKSLKQDLTFRVEGGVYHFMPKNEGGGGMGGSAGAGGAGGAGGGVGGGAGGAGGSGN